ncbi:ATP-binding protein [Kitasatospora sp. NPDC101235]|uniref:ATP-binding protein n=1 Tax=Kitasatospora sp. NPDC101235 TaxID=3364101 RepID=UPI00380B05B0
MDIVRFWEVPLSMEALQELELCASEVIANAMEHAKARCTVTVRRVGERLRVEVADPNPAFERGGLEQESTSGRGLLLVEALAHTWGWHPAEAGKVVWFEFLESREALCPTHGVGGGLPALHRLLDPIPQTNGTALHDGAPAIGVGGPGRNPLS